MRREVGPAGIRRAAVCFAIACALDVSSARAFESTILVSPTPAVGAEMAYAVALDGTSLVVGAPGENALAGAIYAVECAASPCSSPLRIAPVDLAAGDTFGTAVAISGDTIVATSPSTGSAYVYVRDGAGWTEQARLTGGGASVQEHFGFAAALDGDTLAIGANRADAFLGAVYVFTRSGSSWSQQARLTASDPTPRAALGSSVALDGGTLVAGAPFARTAAAGSYARGAAYVFVSSAGAWSQQQRLVASDAADGDLFGYAVDVAGDRAVVGAPYASASKGNAYVFSRNAATWTQQHELSATAGVGGDNFGWSVALGDSVLVGAPFVGQATGTPCGTTYAFDASSLGETSASLVATPVADALTGWSIAASGPRWVVSAPGYLAGSIVQAGAAYWFDPGPVIFGSGFESLAACTGGEEGGGGGGGGGGPKR
jgi:hypothetical protein